MKRIALFILIAVSGLSLNAQTDLDSLLHIWQDETLPDSKRGNAYCDYIWRSFVFSQPDSALVLANELQTFAVEVSDSTLQAQAHHLTGVTYALKSNFAAALDQLQEARRMHKALADTKSVLMMDNALGNVYLQMGDSPNAVAAYRRVRESATDSSTLASVANNISNVYLTMKEYDLVEKYALEALAMYKELGRDRQLVSTYEHLAAVWMARDDLQKAGEYHQLSLAIATKYNDQRAMGISLIGLARIQQEQDSPDSAIYYANQAVEIFDKKGEKLRRSNAVIIVGNSYLDLGKPAKAVHHCEQAIGTGNAFLDRTACDCLHRAHKELGNTARALEYHEQLMALKDSSNEVETSKKLQQMEFDKQMLADSLEHASEIAIQAQEVRRQKTVRNGFMGGFAVVLLFAGVFLVQRNKIGKEKQRSEELLLNILPEETAQELKEKGHSDAQLIDQVTVLFTDFKGFTAMSEQVTPKDLVADLHECFSAFDNICEKYGIEKIKTIGDAYMAAGGLPTPNQTHAKDVVQAALEMAEVVEKGKAKKTAEALPFFEIRIGVHTGPVVAGIVGVKKFQYDIWGDTVNTASRMESSGAVGKVNISEATYDLVKNDFHCEFRGEIEAKGKGKVKMYFVTDNQ